MLITLIILFPDYGYSEWAGNGAAVCSNGIRSFHCVFGCLPPAAGDVWGSDGGHEKRDQRERWSHTSWWVWNLIMFIFGVGKLTSNKQISVCISFLFCAFSVGWLYFNWLYEFQNHPRSYAQCCATSWRWCQQLMCQGLAEIVPSTCWSNKYPASL